MRRSLTKRRLETVVVSAFKDARAVFGGRCELNTEEQREKCIFFKKNEEKIKTVLTICLQMFLSRIE